MFGRDIGRAASRNGTRPVAVPDPGHATIVIRLSDSRLAPGPSLHYPSPWTAG